MFEKIKKYYFKSNSKSLKKKLHNTKYMNNKMLIIVINYCSTGILKIS